MRLNQFSFIVMVSGIMFSQTAGIAEDKNAASAAFPFTQMPKAGEDYFFPQGTQRTSAGDPVIVQPGTIADDYRLARDSIVLGGLPNITVRGTVVSDSYIITANKITFAAGGRIVFSERARAQRNTFVIAAKEIVTSNSRPGEITWFRRNPASGGTTPGEGAPGGSGSANSGQNGGTGSPGGTGRSGGRGEGGPNLVLLTPVRPSPGGLILDFGGQDGGQGGAGQRGGRGGDGGSGRPASSSAIDCRTGAGPGGNGGNGGPGGTGGVGGTGGRGGAVWIAVKTGGIPVMTQVVRTVVQGGDGGSGGPGGVGGSGGSGGPGGKKDLPYCTTKGSDGGNGSRGANGPSGRDGSPGSSGDYFAAELSQAQFDNLFTP